MANEQRPAEPTTEIRIIFYPDGRGEIKGLPATIAQTLDVMMTALRMVIDQIIMSILKKQYKVSDIETLKHMVRTQGGGN